MIQNGKRKESARVPEERLGGEEIVKDDEVQAGK